MKKTAKFLKRIMWHKKQYNSHQIGVYSAQAAFFVLVSAVPFVMASFILAGMLVPIDTLRLNLLLQRYFTPHTVGFIFAALKQLQQNSSVPLLSVTTIFLIWAATKGIRSIGQGISAIYGGKKQFNVVQLALRAAGYMVVLVAVALVSLVLLVLTDTVAVLGKSPLANSIYLLTVAFAAFAFLFAVAYKLLAKSSIPFKMQLAGGAFAAAGWIGYSFGYSVYIRHFSGYPVLYGSFGAVMLFMLWLYMCTNILLCGALFNKLIYYGTNCD